MPVRYRYAGDTLYGAQAILFVSTTDESCEDHGQIGSTSFSHMLDLYCTVWINAAIVLKCSTIGSSPSPRAGDTCTILVFFAKGVACSVLCAQAKQPSFQYMTSMVHIACCDYVLQGVRVSIDVEVRLQLPHHRC